RFRGNVVASFPEIIGGKVIVALSGGSDSMALLLLLHTAADLHLRCHAVHVHHHVRGAEADDDASFCAATCARLGVAFTLAHIDHVRPRGVSSEAWWRSQRYRLLETVRADVDAVAVATGHTLDDQAETVLLKLLRGSGPRGVAGIRPRTARVIRPLLPFRHDELRRFLVAADQRWREDSSNRATELPRVMVRNRILPELESRFPNAKKHLAAFAAALADDERELARELQTRATWPGLRSPVARAGVVALPAALRHRWLLELAARLPLAEPPSREQIAQFDRLLAGTQPSALDLGRHIILRRRGADLVLEPEGIPRFAPIPVGAGATRLPGGFFARIACPTTGERHWAVLRADLLDRHLTWRSVRPGERMPGEPKGRIARLLQGAGVPRPWRSAWPVLEADGRKVWLPAVAVVTGWEAAGGGIRAALEEPWQYLVKS
ncbi:MAG: tRNA lysidine(34) synthetase TilS, partial [Acidobacteria bacterium]|nr:tRNA lysidine(34) synthetase TilS [Acidobacteriota bacterium]